MWETIELVVKQWGIAGLLLVGVSGLIYLLYIDRSKQLTKDTERETRLNEMTDKVINITGEVSKVVSSNTEVFREVSQRLKEMHDIHSDEHQIIITKLDSVKDHLGETRRRLEDKIHEEHRR